MILDWHNRFLQQSQWTLSIRQSLYQRANLASARNVIEIGCGTAAILKELIRFTPAQRFGLDINLDNLSFAHRYDTGSCFTAGDALDLPYQGGQFDTAICHFLLLWVKDPVKAVSEMRRVTRSGGSVCALAEPDYGGRIDYPESLVKLGRLQTESLRSQGADPFIGRRLASIFHEAGLNQVETGVLGGQWSGSPDPAGIQSEWETLKYDLGGSVASSELSQLEMDDLEAYRKGERILFVPTFYAWGIVP